MSLIINEGTKGPSSGDLMSLSDDLGSVVTSMASSTTVTSAFTRVSQTTVGSEFIPVTASLTRDEATPTPASSTTSESPPTLRRAPFEADEDGLDADREDDQDDDESSNQGDNAFAWPTNNSYDEQRQLLGTEEESSDHATSDEEEIMMENFPTGLPNTSTAAANLLFCSSGKRSVWSITREQINYYTTQFFCLQSDPLGVIPGAEAKEFFERSKLPITDLRKIWQLSDVSQDGCLSLEEFLTAMHLVVLKRNNIDLPETLPPVLRPAYLKQRLSKSSKLMVIKPQVTNPNKDLYNGGVGKTKLDHQVCTGRTSGNLEESSERLISATSDEVDQAIDQVSNSRSRISDKNATNCKTDSETADTASIVSSPGRPQPVNFDFHHQDTLRRDPTIIQPVAIRRSPDSPVVQSSDLDEEDEHPHPHQLAHRGRRKPSRGEVGYEKLWNAAGKDEHDDDDEEDSVKEHKSDNLLHDGGVSGPVSLPASRLTSATTSGPTGNSRKDLTSGSGGPGGGATSPPPPPPRGSNPAGAPPPTSGSSYTRSHARSSSLDLNNLQNRELHHKNNSSQILHQRPPTLPPRVEHSRMSSIVSLTGMSRDCRALQCKIQEIRENNSVVARTINELHQEVSDALEERIALEYQLEQLKSFGDE